MRQVSNHYWYQMYMDDLPIWGMVGETSLVPANQNLQEPEEVHGKVYIFTHKQFSIAYNGDQIIEVNLTSQRPVMLDENMCVGAPPAATVLAMHCFAHVRRAVWSATFTSRTA